jgi:hypothetical protein
MSTAATTTEPLVHEPSRWQSYLRRAGIAYLVTRVFVVAGAAIVAAQEVAEANRTGGPRPRNAVGLILQVLTSWDGAWYLKIVRQGYPSSIPRDITYEMAEARAAFFPAYPMIVRVADVVLPGGDVFAAVFVNFVLGALGVYLVGLLARELFDERVAYRAMLLVTFFPGSVALSLTYSEATLMVAAAACLLMLVRRNWVLAGVLASIGSACRPNGIALSFACAVAALIAIRERREWRSLAAPLLSPWGFIGFQLYLKARTGEWAWFRVQTEAWDEGSSFGLTALKNTVEAIIHPLASPTDIITAVSVFTMIALAYMMWRTRLPWPIMTFTIVVLALMVMPSTVTARPRFLFTAFPLFISAAAWWPEEHEETWGLVLAMCSAGLVTLAGLYGVLGAIP